MEGDLVTLTPAGRLAMRGPGAVVLVSV